MGEWERKRAPLPACATWKGPGSCNDRISWRGLTANGFPPNVVPPEYTDFAKTPLVVDTADKETFNLKIRKPAKK